MWCHSYSSLYWSRNGIARFVHKGVYDLLATKSRIGLKWTEKQNPRFHCHVPKWTWRSNSALITVCYQWMIGKCSLNYYTAATEHILHCFLQIGPLCLKAFSFIFQFFCYYIYISPQRTYNGIPSNSIASSAPRWQDNELEDWGRKGTKQLRINSVESASSDQSSFAVMEVDMAIASRLQVLPPSFCNKPTCYFSPGFWCLFFWFCCFSHTILNISRYLVL